MDKIYISKRARTSPVMTMSRRLLTRLWRKLCHSYLKNKSSTVGSTLSSAETQRTVSTACCAPGRKLPWCHIITCEAPLVRLDQAGCPPFSLLSPSSLHSSGTLAGTLLKQRYSAEQRYSGGKGRGRGTLAGTLLQQRYSARESVLFIGTQFSILYTFVYSPA